MVMNVKMEARTWEQFLLILLQITQLVLPEAPFSHMFEFWRQNLASKLLTCLIKYLID